MTATPVFFATPQAFRAWLEVHGASEKELLVGCYKLGSGLASMSWPESVDEALCFGWIDGVRRRIDDLAYCIRFTPRKPSSIWSAVNIANYARLLTEGRITAAGETAYSHRRQEKSIVYAYEQAEVEGLSEAEQVEFAASEQAWAFFQSTPPGYQKVILHWLNSAKKLETRRARFQKLVQASLAKKRL